jgi:hypothetical protein
VRSSNDGTKKIAAASTTAIIYVIYLIFILLD